MQRNGKFSVQKIRHWIKPKAREPESKPPTKRELYLAQWEPKPVEPRVVIEPEFATAAAAIAFRKYGGKFQGVSL